MWLSQVLASVGFPSCPPCSCAHCGCWVNPGDASSYLYSAHCPMTRLVDAIPVQPSGCRHTNSDSELNFQALIVLVIFGFPPIALPFPTHNW
ncbi:hypothetical protein B0H12DRAFT_1108814 [Mycena haematopus]|nr:hypothetical protein B0H12DRAFT_1108814 [Mycena haematopus]